MPGRTHATHFHGIAFAHLDLDGATRLLLSPRGLDTAVPWRLVNSYSISLMAREHRYASVLRGDGINLADGRPVTWALAALSRRAGTPTLPGHVRGPSLFDRVLDESQGTGVRHFLLGGTPYTLARLEAAIAARYPKALVVGVESPPFRPLTAEERIEQDERIRASGADIVWVGLGTPRQDIEAERLAQTVGRPVVAVGAAFDFLAGTKREAPVWVQRAALEWLFRLASEPRRLWRRYTTGLLRFGLVCARELARPRVTPPPPRPLPVRRSTWLVDGFAEAERQGA
jgi:N-acetylglucosaminyldiphosphoundecaprenol N-acetyl-beta-D-mannosaminyltransferase